LLSEYLEKVAGENGFTSHRIPVPDQCSDLLITYERDPSLPWIIFDSHLDTVAVDGMTIEPFAGMIKDGKLYGRGSCDTKGSGAAMLCALLEYSGSSQGSNNIALLYSVDEEHGMSGIRAFVQTGLPSIGHVKGAVIGEPTRLKPVVAHNGVQRYIVFTEGVAAHSADPSRGRSAITDMASLILEIEGEFIPTLEATHPLTGKAQCSINVIRGGSAVNIIPDRCEIQVDRRTVPGENPAQVIAQLRDFLDEYRKTHPDVTLDFTAAVETPPLTPSEDGSFRESIISILSNNGCDGEPIGVRYATHAGDLCAAGVPSIVLGPGDIDQGHTKDEWIDISELEASIPIYLEIMQRG
jgi:acetylornithine deacetylase